MKQSGHQKACNDFGFLFCFLFRFLYVRSSLQSEVTTVFKRDSFTLKFIFLAFLYNLFDGGLILLEHKGPGRERTHFVLYHACLDPWSDYPSHMFTKSPTYITLMFFSGATCLVNIVCNLFLYRFLETHRLKNVGMSF